MSAMRVPTVISVALADELDARERVSQICCDAIASGLIADWTVDEVETFDIEGETRTGFDVTFAAESEDAVRQVLLRGLRLDAFSGAALTSEIQAHEEAPEGMTP